MEPEVPSSKKKIYGLKPMDLKFHIVKICPEACLMEPEVPSAKNFIFLGLKPYLILMDPEAPYTKNFILVWIEMKICKPLENCLG